MKKHFLLTLLIISFLKENSQTFKKIDYSSGLASYSIEDIKVDKAGNLWIATFNSGLIKYDGINFETFADKKDSSTYFVRKIFQDSDTGFYVGNSLGLYYLNLNTNTYKKIVLPERIKGNYYEVVDIIKVNGVLYFLSSRGAIFYKNGNNYFFVDVNFAFQKRIHRNIVAYENKIYGGLDNGFFEYYILKKTLQEIKLSTEHQSMQNMAVFRDTLVIATPTGLKFIKNNKLIKTITINAFPKTNKNIYSVVSSKNGNYLLVGGRGFVAKYFSDGVYQIYDIKNGLSDNPVLKIIENENKQIIVSNYVDGIYVLGDVKIKNFVNLQENNNNILHISKLDKDILFFNTPLAIYKMNIKDEKIEKIISSDQLGNIEIDNFYSLDQNNFIVNTIDNKFIHTNTQQKLKITPITNRFKFSLNSIHKNKQGEILLGTNIGIYKIDCKQTLISKVNYAKLHGLVKSIEENHEGEELILGGSAIYKFNQKDSVRLGSGYFMALTEDYKGNYWIRRHYSLLLYDQQKFINLSQKVNFPIYGIKSLNAFGKYVVLITIKGVYVINAEIYYKKGEIKYDFYDAKDGLISDNITAEKCVVDPEGNLWIGTDNGLTKLNIIPDSVKKLSNPIVYLKKIKLFQEEVNWFKKGYKTSFLIPENPLFKYDENNITFQFAGDYLFNPTKLSYSIKLDGLDRNFCAETKINEINYSSLPSGKYKLLIKVKKDGYNWSDNILEYSFEIAQPFYKKAWFTVLCGILFSIILVAYIKYRERKIRKQNEVLEKLVNKRTQQLNDRNEKLNTLYTTLEGKNHTIHESIEYALHLQSFILRIEKKHFKNVLNYKNYELLFLPKDIVSGDFYTVFRSGKNTFVVLADCTGHGVPGAIISIFAYESLKQLIVDRKFTDLSMILTEVNNYFYNTFNKSSYDRVSDSLAISILKITDFESQVSIIASQQNFLMVTHNLEIEEFKFENTPLNIDPKRAIYESKNIDLSPYKSIILYTDGIVDQKGGSLNKRLLKHGFKTIIKEKYKSSKNYEQILREWKGENEQVDDMTLLQINLSE